MLRRRSHLIIKSAIWTVLLAGDIEFSAYISINGDAKIAYFSGAC